MNMYLWKKLTMYKSELAPVRGRRKCRDSSILRLGD